jgi:hypothetical protein
MTKSFDYGIVLCIGLFILIYLWLLHFNIQSIFMIRSEIHADINNDKIICSCELVSEYNRER